MVSALVIARLLTQVGVSNPWIARHPRFTGLGYVGKIRGWLDRTDPDLMSRRKLWLAGSLVALAAAVAGIVGPGLNLGVEFTGGRTLDYSTSQEVSVDEARDAIAAAGFEDAVVQGADTADFTVRTGDITNEEEDRIEAALAEIGGDVTQEDSQRIGASLGNELRDKALIAFGIALLAQMLYLAVRFKWTFGLAAVLAMFHDVVLVVGLFAWLGKPIDGVFLAAALTIVGLSVNDTVVVFDRIRERWRGSTDRSFVDIANKACVETMPRTVNTGLGAMFILAALALLGGDSLQDFAIALLVGLIVGTYSSVFTATPILTYLQAKYPMPRTQKVKVERDPDDSGAVL
jgi:SecD/SecF fusion protein